MNQHSQRLKDFQRKDNAKCIGKFAVKTSIHFENSFILLLSHRKLKKTGNRCRCNRVKKMQHNCCSTTLHTEQNASQGAYQDMQKDTPVCSKESRYVLSPNPNSQSMKNGNKVLMIRSRNDCERDSRNQKQLHSTLQAFSF